MDKYIAGTVPAGHEKINISFYRYETNLIFKAT